jgi:hypothetical protein
MRYWVDLPGPVNVGGNFRVMPRYRTVSRAVDRVVGNPAKDVRDLTNHVVSDLNMLADTLQYEPHKYKRRRNAIIAKWVIAVGIVLAGMIWLFSYKAPPPMSHEQYMQTNPQIYTRQYCQTAPSYDQAGCLMMYPNMTATSSFQN